MPNVFGPWSLKNQRSVLEQLYKGFPFKPNKPANIIPALAADFIVFFCVNYIRVFIGYESRNFKESASRIALAPTFDLFNDQRSNVFHI